MTNEKTIIKRVEEFIKQNQFGSTFQNIQQQPLTYELKDMTLDNIEQFLKCGVAFMKYPCEFRIQYDKYATELNEINNLNKYNEHYEQKPIVPIEQIMKINEMLASAKQCFQNCMVIMDFLNNKDENLTEYINNLITQCDEILPPTLQMQK